MWAPNTAQLAPFDILKTNEAEPTGLRFVVRVLMAMNQRAVASPRLPLGHTSIDDTTSVDGIHKEPMFALK